MFDELKIYKETGHFFLKKGDSLKAVCNAPDMPGVYLIVRLAKGKVRLVYIGKSGTMKQNGEFKDQGLFSRINNKQDGTNRQEFFNKKFEAESIDALDIYWYETFNNKIHHLPAFVEATVMQVYFEVNGELPLWNKEF